jgi:hypothetical protein
MICHEREAVVRRNEHFEIVSYTCIFLSKVRSFLDFRFSLNVFIYFVNFKSLKHTNLFSKIILKYLIANKNRNDLKLPVANKFFYLCCRKIFMNFPAEVA